MKDRFEVRFTVATCEIEGKATKAFVKLAAPFAKKLEPYILNIVEATTKIIEKEVEKELGKQ